MQTIDTILSTHSHREEQERAIYRLIGIDQPGAYAILEPDSRLMVWDSEKASENDDGARATYRSRDPISPEAWSVIQSLAWIEDSEAI